MNKFLQTSLFEKYPDFFKGHKLSSKESCLARGLECQDGWFDLIKSACAVIEHYNKERERLSGEMPQFEFTQVKEKFGGLRMYCSGSDDYIRGVIDLAETLSYKVCEITGKPGKVCISETGWYKTLCQEKMEELNYQPYNRKAE
jgi:hypothetical protein